MSVSYTPTYYSLPGGRTTGETTLGPVSPTEAFYQEQQDGYKCTLHSLNAFAGRHVVDFTAFAKVYNNFYIETRTPYMDPDDIKKWYLLESMDDLALPTKSSESAYPIACFISQNKKLFQLPETCTIKWLTASPSYEKESFQEAIHYINTHSSIHRIWSSSEEANHAFTFRKDSCGQWRVIDSWTEYHDANEQDPLKRLQPAFPTFQQALESHFTRLGVSKYRLVYPTEDAIPSSSPLAPDSDTTVKPIIRQACCLVRLWNWFISRICALFCCRRSQ